MVPLLSEADAVFSSEQARAFIENGNTGVLLAADDSGRLAKIIVNDPIICKTAKGNLAVKRESLINIAKFIMRIAQSISPSEHDLVEVDLNLGVNMKKIADSNIPTTKLTLTMSLWNKFVETFPFEAPRASDFRNLSQNLGYLWA